IGAAIVAFSIGVELGHQLVVLPLFCGLKLTRLIRSDATSRDRLSLSTMRIGSVFICAAGTVYLVAALK
ncbi:MAG: hypothetical protein L0Y39_06840, partial [Methylococcaceae bacterium]|nr:hypothetical protein [Methylococcaceae bacterium]